MAAPNASASALKRAIRDFLAENGDSPAADDLRKAEKALGASDSPPDSPGRRVAREAASSSKSEAPAGDAKPNSPGADMNNPPSPGGFQGIKQRDTAKTLARLRFKDKRKK